MSLVLRLALVSLLTASRALACVYDRDALRLLRRDGAGPMAFSYTGESGPLGWARLAPANGACANGTHQSPIVIDSKNTARLPIPPTIILPDVAAGATQLENLGVTLEVVANGTLVAADGTKYALQQFHFHTPSEHRIDGEYFPLEMHMVFKSSLGNVSVLGVPFELSDSGNSTALLTAVFANLGQASNPGSDAPTGALHFDEVLSAVQFGPIYTYNGSLTTPPCTEDVAWMVLGTPLPLDIKTYKAVKKVLKYNARLSQNTPGSINLIEYAAQGILTNYPPSGSRSLRGSFMFVIIIALGIVTYIAA